MRTRYEYMSRGRGGVKFALLLRCTTITPCCVTLTTCITITNTITTILVPHYIYCGSSISAINRTTI